MKAKVLFLLFFSMLSFGSLAEEEKCIDWSLSVTSEWLGCNWEAKWEGDTADALVDVAKGQIKAIALGAIADAIPGGGILASFTTGGPSEIDLAVERILEAISASEARLSAKMLEYYEARDYASLEAFKTAVARYRGDDYEVRYDNVQTLSGLWQASLELAGYFSTYSDLDSNGIAGSIHTYHTYLSIVSLQLLLSAELSAYQYQKQDKESEIERIVLENYNREIAVVFGHVDAIDWRGSTESLITNRSDHEGSGSFDAYNYQLEFEFNGEEQKIKSECYPEVNNGHGAIKYCRLVITGSNLAEVLGVEPGIQYKINKDDFYDNGGRAAMHPPTIYNAFVDELERQIIVDGYSSTVEILNSWQSMISSDTRKSNYADGRLASYFTSEGMKVDSDFDGFDDEFEGAHLNEGFFIDIWNDGGADYDSDGYSDIVEYKAGTDLFDANDNPKIRQDRAAWLVPVISLILN